IEGHLLQSGYTRGVCYHKELGLDTALLWGFLEKTQAKALEDLGQRDANFKQHLLERLKQKIKEKGMLKMLKEGIEHLGLSFKLAYNKPQTQKNLDAWQNYQSNVFSLMRQLHYSTKNNNSVDLAIFLNGLPLFTLELKHSLNAQNAKHALKQYGKRDPHEPLFKHALAHFALDESFVYLATKLEGTRTHFIPFNKGLNDGSAALDLECGAGNPLNPQGFKSAYLWEQVLQKDQVLNLIFNFLQPVGRGVIFPRYHQLSAVQRLCAAVLKDRVGGRYLIEHGAGSGKSNTIAWLTYALVGLSVDEKPLFDSVLVITDRIILDKQLQENIQSFFSIKGVVEAITEGSCQLKEALAQGKKVIIATIQKFPYILEELPSLTDKKFAIIIDEAHSSQGGAYGDALKKATGAPTQEELDPDAFLLQTIKAKQFNKNASYFAFSATPKPETLELFGTKTKAEQFIPFHLYSMKQAIEEGFILDVLKFYTTYTFYANLVAKAPDDPLYERDPAFRKLKTYVKEHPKSIEEKTKAMLAHFYTNTHHKIGGRAKAMVITSSRQVAMRYFKAFQAQLAEEKRPHKALVAFSGEVQGQSEASLNGFSESQTPKAFDTDAYRFLIVADKYQTGFDQPLLYTMYVDKALSGVACVQTLSRLNRIHPNKKDTCILDFENDTEKISKAFEPYYKQTFLAKPSDPNKLYDLKSHLEGYGVYTQEQIEAFYLALLKAPLPKIHAMLDQMALHYHALEPSKQQEFYSKAKTYLKNYAFLVQILPYQDLSLEKLFRLLQKLIKKLAPFREDDEDITKAVELKDYRLQIAQQDVGIALEGQAKLHPSKADSSSHTPQSELEKLSEILEEFSRAHGVPLGEQASKALKDTLDRMRADPIFMENFNNSDHDNQWMGFNKRFKDESLSLLESNEQLYNELTKNKDFEDLIRRKLFEILMRGAHNGPKGF
ncbi:type I restriction endonuclease subunit R, partial [Helicobacter heilmannii]